MASLPLNVAARDVLYHVLDRVDPRSFATTTSPGSAPSLDNDATPT